MDIDLGLFRDKSLPTPTQHPVELKELIKVLREIDAKTMVELGVSDAGTSLAIVENTDIHTSVGVDNKIQDSSIDYETLSDTSDIIFVMGNCYSEDTFEEVKNILPETDFVFIDAGSSYGQIITGFEMYRDIVSDGGIMGFHDVTGQYSGIEKAWKEIEAGYETELIFSDEPLDPDLTIADEHPGRIGRLKKYAGIGLVWL